jgi:hypothetical protein
MNAGGSSRLIGVALVVALCSAGVFAGGVVAQSGPAADEPAFVVDLHDDGTGAVTITYTFDLDDDSEQAAFEELRTDEEALAEFRDRFDSRLSAVAADASETTGREMSVSDVTVETERIDGTGVVTVSLTWNGLAATGDGQLTVTEPFASGFEPDRTLYVTAPDGYEFASSSPDPNQQSERSLAWTAGSDLSGFEAVATASDDPEMDSDGTTDSSEDDTGAESTDGTDDSGSGFGLFAAIAGLVGIALFAGRRS